MDISSLVERQPGKSTYQVPMTRFLLALLLLVGGCANPNPFRVPDESAATLQSRITEKDGHRLSLIFMALDGTTLRPGFTTAAAEASFKAPAGKRNLLVRVAYAEGSTIVEARALLAGELLVAHTYVVDAELSTDSAKLWIRDAENEQSASRVVTQGLTPIRIFPAYIPIPPNMHR